MWIRTQNRQRIVNTDQVIDIFVDKTGTKIMAETTRNRENGDFLTLGEYENRDTCLEILDVLMIVGDHDDVKWLQLPLGGDVESWLNDSHHMAEKLYIYKKGH